MKIRIAILLSTLLFTCAVLTTHAKEASGSDCCYTKVLSDSWIKGLPPATDDSQDLQAPAKVVSNDYSLWLAFSSDLVPAPCLSEQRKLQEVYLILRVLRI